jgi:energy-converting hydrogenase Eha subunit B
VNVATNTNPIALVLTGSTICASPGNNGTITSSTSVSGINYQLYNSANAIVQTAKAGNGSALIWSSLAAGTGYYVIGTNATTSCTSTSNTASVANSPLPTTAAAGNDQTQCNNGSFTLAGNNPASGTGAWTVTSGTATVTTPSSYNSGVTGVPAGTSATLTWTISSSPCVSSTDGVVLTNNAATSIGSSSLTAQTQCLNGTFSPITVTATGTGTLTYQWYSSSSASTSGGTTVGTNSNNYTPSAAVAGTLYYYCVVTGTCGIATSAASGAFVVNPLPTPTLFAAGATTFCQGGSVVLNVSGNALKFGSNSRVEINDDPSLRFTDAQSYTVMAWVYVESYKSSVRGIVTKSRDQGSQYGIYLNEYNQWVYGAGLSYINITSPEVAKIGWQHIAIVQTGGGSRELFVDGILVKSGTAQSSTGTGKLRFGQSFDNFEKFDGGMLDEVSIFNTNLNSETINTWKNTSISNAHPNYANLVGYWKLDEGTGSATTADASGHGQIGTLVNSPVWVATSALGNEFSSYLWSPGSATTPTLSVTSSGTYSVNVTDANGCTQTTSGTTVTVNPLPAALSLTGSTICASPGGNGTITSTTSVSGVSYQLYNLGNATVQGPLAGTGSALTWSSLPAAT